MSAGIRSRRIALVVTLACAVCACSDSAGESAGSPTSESPAPGVQADLPRIGQADPTALTGAGVGGFRGFGPARFGDDHESVRDAWGRPLNASEPAAGSSCYYLTPDPAPPGVRGVAFMIVEGEFVRYDVDDPQYVAPGGIVLGDTAAKVTEVHQGRLDIQPHKYVAGGRNFIVSPPGGGDTRLVFEMSPVGRVVTWRIGVPPQVYYVEGCG